MKNQPIPEVLQNIRLVATDMDGTLTQKGNFFYSDRTINIKITVI